MHPVLEPLFRGWPVLDGIVLHGAVLPAYDCYTSVFDLPYRFGTTLENILAEIPYLPQLAPEDATRVEGDGRPKIGVVWGGSALHLNDSRRSVPLALFKDIFEEKRLQFFSLNRDMKEGDTALP